MAADVSFVIDDFSVINSLLSFPPGSITIFSTACI